jgi:hypothetical protein
MAALPWATGAPRDPLLDASANVALLAAAKQLGVSGGDDAEAAVMAALAAMDPRRRAMAVAALQSAQERVYGAICRLREAHSGPIRAEEVHEEMNKKG